MFAAVALVAACQPEASVLTPSQVPASSASVAPPVSATPTPSPAPTSSPPPSDIRNVEITWYGSYDNDPKGSLTIDHPVIHLQAGGTGTYADPLTFASPAGPGEYAYGLRIYVPAVRKYFIREDSCAQSWTAKDGCGPVSHVDLYIGNPSSDKSVLGCEDALTPDGVAPIQIDPPADLPVDPAPLWVQSTKTCHTKTS